MRVRVGVMVRVRVRARARVRVRVTSVVPNCSAASSSLPYTTTSPGSITWLGLGLG